MSPYLLLTHRKFHTGLWHYLSDETLSLLPFVYLVLLYLGLPFSSLVVGLCLTEDTNSLSRMPKQIIITGK